MFIYDDFLNWKAGGGEGTVCLVGWDTITQCSAPVVEGSQVMSNMTEIKT